MSSSQEDEKGKDFCPKCKVEVKSEDKATVCDTCGNWFHIQCAKINVKQYELMKKDEMKIMHWFCSGCEETTINTGKTLYLLSAKQEKLEADLSKFKEDTSQNLANIKQDYNGKVDGLSGEISKLRKIVTDMKLVQDCQALTLTGVQDKVSQTKMIDCDFIALVDKKIQDYDTVQTEKVKKQEPVWAEALNSQVKKSMENVKKEIEPSFAEVVSKQVNSKFEKVSTDIVKVQQVLEDTKKKADEEKDRENRSNNVIIYRVAESDVIGERLKQDKAFVLQLTKEILEIDIIDEDIKFVMRLGKKTDVVRPLLVQFREKCTKNRVMESLFKLKDAEDKFKHISVTHDLTKSERTECKSMVEQAKQKQIEEKGEYLWRVRGLPGALKIIRIQKK